MLPKNLISFVALHAPIIIHATLAMTLSHQVIEGSEDIKSMETAPITGEVDFGDEFDEVKCRQNKETIGSMKKDMTTFKKITFNQGKSKLLELKPTKKSG
ncbi:hypothetical protein H4Q26_002401 [Puccinia striiformis f. sp. tritici PST-130]|nr:hypothetical protein H4Q26_002401 [Puccinia striiformis f. sp. tritici PST-130]